MKNTDKPKKTKALNLATPYPQSLDAKSYNIEKRRLQLELLRIQQKLVKKHQRMAIIFEGRDAAGKGTGIKCFSENLMPHHYRIIDLAIPTEKESKHWFRRYQIHMPQSDEMVFFDRSWYSRALIEPTMGYCSEAQYRYFMAKVLDWEHQLIQSGIKLIKFYLSVNRDTQMYRFNERLSDPLKYWKFSPNDLRAREREKWVRFTRYKEQMFKHTSSDESPWVVVNSNNKLVSRLTCMLYLVNNFGNPKFKTMSGVDVANKFEIKVQGVNFKNLSAQQYAILKQLRKNQA